jgi:hypothetical protein
MNDVMRILVRAGGLLLITAILLGYGLMVTGCASSDMDRCLEYGFLPGAEGFASCRMNLDLHG